MSAAELISTETIVVTKLSRIKRHIVDAGVRPSCLTPLLAAMVVAMGLFAVEISECGRTAAAQTRPPAPKLHPGGIKIDVGPVNVFGNAGEGRLAVNVDGKMDRITLEILNDLSKSKVLIVWMVDQSESFQDERDEVFGRIDRVYSELERSGATKPDGLSTAVFSYGTATINHTPIPMTASAEIAAALRKVPVDNLGQEMQCLALSRAAESFSKLAESEKRRLVLFLLTDESGDRKSNLAELESTIELCRKAKAKVHVIGREALFGDTRAYIQWLDPAKKSEFRLPIDRGSETPEPELLQFDGLSRRQDAFPCGFGPYEQARIARETGGLFFLLESPELQLLDKRPDIAYDAATMKLYLPDLMSRDEYVAARDGSPFRKAVFQIICDLDPSKPGSTGAQLELRTGDFSIHDPKLAVEANTQMRKAAELIAYLKRSELALVAMKPRREKETSLRWRANYDLLLAQTIACQARAEEYGWYLAEFIKTSKRIRNPLGPSKQTNAWKLRPAKRLVHPATSQATTEKADALFRQVLEDHAGTPWAIRATDELNRGYGVEFVEDYIPPERSAIKMPKL